MLTDYNKSKNRGTGRLLLAVIACLSLSLSYALAQERPDSCHWIVDALSDGKGKYVFKDFDELNKAIKERHADTLTVFVKPWVYWIDNPDDSAIRRGNPPIAMAISCRKLTIIGLGKTADETVLACQRGQSQGADGNFTMFDFGCEKLVVRNLTMGNYLNADLDYKPNPKLSRKRRSDVITQAQLAFMHGKRLMAENCRFVSRLNLCPIVGADGSLYRNCHFESTDDALNGNARYEDCDFDFYSSKPLYNTSGHGATFIRCSFNILHGGYQFFTKHPGKVKVVDCKFIGPDSVYVGWSGDTKPWIRCYQANNTLNGSPLFIDKNHKELTVGGAGAAYRSIGVTSNISAHDITVQAGTDTAVLKASAVVDGHGKEKALPIEWKIEKGYEKYLRMNVYDDGSCMLIPVNGTAEAKRFCVTAVAGDSLAEEACVLTVNPKERPVPMFTEKPKIDIENGVARLSYKLDLGDASDCSDVEWYRTTENGYYFLMRSEEVAGSSIRPNMTYHLRPSDEGAVIEARVFAKTNCSRRAEKPEKAESRRITRSDMASPFVLETDFSDLPRLLPYAGEDNWCAMRFKPADTKYYEWNQDDPGKFSTPWYYGYGTGGCKDSLGLLQNIQGARLVYHPKKRDYGDISLELDVTPAKTAGQGFSSNRMQYMDVCIKYDNATMSGYGLRIMRTLKHGNAVDFQLMEFDKESAKPVSRAVSSTCYRGNCKIILTYRTGVLTCEATTDQPSVSNELPNKVSLSAKVRCNGFGDFVIQHTGTTGEGQTMLRHMRLSYDN